MQYGERRVWTRGQRDVWPTNLLLLGFTQSKCQGTTSYLSLRRRSDFSQAMRYPLNAHRKELAAAADAREREKELAKEIQEGDLDDEDLGGDF